MKKEEVNWKRQRESETKFTLETDKGDFYIDKVRYKEWARTVIEFLVHTITSGEKGFTVYYDDAKNILQVNTKKGLIFR